MMTRAVMLADTAGRYRPPLRGPRDRPVTESNLAPPSFVRHSGGHARAKAPMAPDQQPPSPRRHVSMQLFSPRFVQLAMGLAWTQREGISCCVHPARRDGAAMLSRVPRRRSVLLPRTAVGVEEGGGRKGRDGRVRTGKRGRLVARLRRRLPRLLLEPRPAVTAGHTRFNFQWSLRVPRFHEPRNLGPLLRAPLTVRVRVRHSLPGPTPGPMAEAAGGGEGITVEDEQFKRGARRTRKIARRLKRAARLTDRMASELQSSADEWFSRISHGWAAPYACVFPGRPPRPSDADSLRARGRHAGLGTDFRFRRRSGAFCTGNNYDPGMFVKRGEESRRVRDKWERQSPEPGIWPDNHLKSSFRDSFGWPRRREGAGEGVKPATEEGVRPATARPQTGAARSVASTPRDEPPASRAGSMSARSDPRACNGSKGTVPTPRASTARSRPIRMLAESPSTFTRIPAVCTNRSPINLMEEYVPPYTVDRLLEERAQEKAQEARERNVRPTSVCTEASSAIRGPANELYVARDVVSAARYRVPLTFPRCILPLRHGKRELIQDLLKHSRNSSFSEINLIGKTMKGRQETFLTTRTRTPRALGSPDDCGVCMRL